MSTLTKKLIHASFAGAVVTVLVAASYGCDQQKPRCTSAHGDFAAKYTPAPGSPASCADLKGEILGINSYNPPGKGGNPDLDKTTVAIQSNELGTAWDNADLAGLHDPDATHKEYSLGAFTSAAPTNDFCTVPSLSPAIQNIPAVTADDDLGTTDAPATSISYEWSNVRFYVTASAYGSQMAADLKRTQDGVSCVYKVIAIYPYVDCSAPDPNDDTKSVPDNGACAPEADVDAGRPTGSGINPDFPTVCDPDLLACMLTGSEIPVLR
jgi:hypothetical protein